MKHEIIDISIVYGCIVQRMLEQFPKFPHKFYFVLFNSKYIIFHLQGWGDHTDISQAVAMYILAAGSLCLYCWLANELSQQVRNYAFKSDLNLRFSLFPQTQISFRIHNM
jgi:hypothetical protein